MSTALALPSHTAPLNLSLPVGARATVLDSDTYDICGRIAEISPALKLTVLEQGDKYAFAIIETCDDGWERLVFKVQELDARVITRLQKIMSMSLSERVRILEEENHRFEQDEHEKSLDDLYERVGRPMLTDLEKCGFIQRSTSYPKAGATGGKGSKAKA